MLDHGQFRTLRRLIQLRRREARVVRAVVSFLLAAGLVWLVAYALAASPPSWWSAAEIGAPPAPAEARRLATVLENVVVTELTRVRSASAAADAAPPGSPSRSDPWAIRIKDHEINAWLATKLPGWIEGEGIRRGAPWPATVRDFRVHIAPDALTVGARVGEGAGRVVWIRLTPRVDEQGLFLRAAAAGIGRLPLPLRSLLPSERGDALLQAGDGIRTGWAGFPHSPRLRDAILGEAPAVADASVRLADGRRVHLLGVHLEDRALVLTCATAPAP